MDIWLLSTTACIKAPYIPHNTFRPTTYNRNPVNAWGFPKSPKC